MGFAHTISFFFCFFFSFHSWIFLKNYFRFICLYPFVGVALSCRRKIEADPAEEQSARDISGYRSIFQPLSLRLAFPKIPLVSFIL